MGQITLRKIHDALTEAFDKIRLSDGSILFATNNISELGSVSDSRLPTMVLLSGRLTPNQYYTDTTEEKLTIPVRLKVKGRGNGDGSNAMRSAVDDIINYCDLIKGMPIDKATGQVVPFSDTTATQYENHELVYIANIGGPYVAGDVNMYDSGDSPYAVAEFNFVVRYFNEHNLIESPPVKVVEIGLPDAPQVPDPNIPFVDQIRQPPLPKDVYASGGYNTKSTVKLNMAYPSSLPYVVGPNKANVTRNIQIIPTPISLSAGSSLQIVALSNNADYSATAITQSASYQIANTAVATISNTGSIFGVSAGATTLTVTYQSVSASVVITVS